MSNSRAEIVAALQKASSLSEQLALVAELDAFEARQASAAADSRSIDLAGAVVEHTLSPVRVHEFHTASTDWLAMDSDTEDNGYHQQVMAKAALWFNKISEEVKADREEFAEQARGIARRTASAYGVYAPDAEQSFLQYVAFLNREAASGLDQIDQLIDPNNMPKPTEYPVATFPTFEDPVHPINEQAVAEEGQWNNPLLAEIAQDGNAQGQAEWPSVHGDPAFNGAFDGAADRTVAISHAYNLDEFRQREAAESKICSPCLNGNHSGTNGTAGCRGGWCRCEGKGCGKASGGGTGMGNPDTRGQKQAWEKEAASTLDQITQTTAPDGVTYRPTPLPVDVAFPLTAPFAGEVVDPAAETSGRTPMFGVPTGEDLLDEEEAAEQGKTGSRRPLGKTAGGMQARDMADMDVPLEQAIDWHLSTNHYPPIPGFMVKPAIEAINAHNEGDHDREIELPEGVSHASGRTAVYPHELIEHMHLHPWLADEDEDLHYESSRKAAGVMDPIECTECGWNGNALLGYDPEKKSCPMGCGDTVVLKSSKEASRKTADMYGNSDLPHAVPQPNVANTPATTPQPQQGGSYMAGFAAGMADGVRGDAATYADNSSGLPFAQGYVDGYSKGFGEFKDGRNPQDVPRSMGGDSGQGFLSGTAAKEDGADVSKLDLSMPTNYIYDFTKEPGDAGSKVEWRGHAPAPTKVPENTEDLQRQLDRAERRRNRRTSSMFTPEEAFDSADFRKGYKFASTWGEDKPLVRAGSAEFEAGLYAGISDNISAQSAWVAKHRKQAKKYPEFKQRIALHKDFSDNFARTEGGIVVSAYLRSEAATSTDLDTLSPTTSPSPAGSTPINGPGRPGPLAGGMDPAAPGGPAPYNAAEPFGQGGVVPGGISTVTPATTQLTDPDTQPSDVRSLAAFRNRVQAGLNEMFSNNSSENNK